ncbi:MAG: WXG100 family type VII secretion target [Propionibacterium sp.]|nr:WXG100 family type VII secretion target [Propionibacterium sp.]
MSGNTSVDRAEMAKAAGQIEESANAIDGVQRNLQSRVQGLIGSGWQGNAAQAFLNAFTDFDSQFARVQQALVGIHENLSSTQMQYTSTEDAQAQSTNAISAILNG